jgi:hypothetical protein
LTYHSPHKFRHGHAVYALKLAKDIAALKAVSQNLMHENLSITDGVYWILSEIDVRNQIAAIGKEGSVVDSVNNDQLAYLLKRILDRLELRQVGDKS